jgi:hypothetical protein
MTGDTIRTTFAVPKTAHELLARQANELGVTMGQVFTEAAVHYLTDIDDGRAPKPAPAKPDPPKPKQIRATLYLPRDVRNRFAGRAKEWGIT